MSTRREFITLLVGAAGNEGAAMRCMLPVTLSLTLILLTSWALVEARGLDLGRDPEDLALVYLFPTILIARQLCRGYELVRRRARCGLFHIPAVRQHSH